MYFSYALAIAAVLPVVVAMLLLGYGAAPIYLVSCLVLVVLAPSCSAIPESSGSTSTR